MADLTPDRLQELSRIAEAATPDPPTVLALLDEIERLRRERGETHFALYHPDLDWWECQAKDCGFLWEFMEDGDPYEHDMRFCPRCGRRIVGPVLECQAEQEAPGNC